MKSELLVELGVEELPASFVDRAFRQLRDELVRLLETHRLGFGESVALGTPRRLIVVIKDVASVQWDETKEVRGPAIKAAFDSDGRPTKALEGFCRGQGVEVSSVRQEGDYTWVTKTELGRPAIEVLPSVIESAIRGLTFDKSMRWGASKVRFARPIRWLVALLNGEVIPCQIESVTSAAESRGHRFNHPEAFQVTGFDQLVNELRRRGVEPDPSIRRERVIATAKAVASGEPEMTEALIDENTYLTEWPEALEGEFKSEFMVLPEPVLVTAMAKHERFFPVRGTDGRLTNRFISIRNGGEEATVRSGNAWVLNARFNDAKFFFDEDSKFGLDDFLGRTERMLFQEKLGSVRKRADRLVQLADRLLEAIGASDSERSDAREAALFAKADLATGLVSELSSLQGVVGGEYAKREGKSASVVHALTVQYAHDKVAGAVSSEGRVARAVILADQMDKLAGYLGLGLAPTGSSDPYGLRRAVTICIEVAWNWEGFRTPYAQVLDWAFESYERQGHSLDRTKARDSLRDLFLGRYKALLTDARYDVLDAAMPEEDLEQLSTPRTIELRVKALGILAESDDFVRAAIRPLNIVRAAEQKGVSPASAATELQSAEGDTLREAVVGAKAAVEAAQSREDAVALAEALRPLQAPIHAFFESTMVMVDDVAVRDARINLLGEVGLVLKLAGDWTKIVVE